MKLKSPLPRCPKDLHFPQHFQVGSSLLIVSSKSFQSCMYHIIEPDPSVTRFWTDASGTFRVEAQFVELKDNLVQLHKINGVKITVPFQRFSSVDQDHIRHITNTSGIDGSKDLSYTTNGFDWYEFFIKAGISENDAKTYAHRFVLKKMDSSMMNELDFHLLKDLGVNAEGDIIRIRRAIARITYESASKFDSGVSSELDLSQNFSQTNLTAKSLTKIKEEQDRQKAMELSQAAKAFHTRQNDFLDSTGGQLKTTSQEDRKSAKTPPITSEILDSPRYSRNFLKDRLKTPQDTTSSFSQNWTNEIKSVPSGPFYHDRSNISNDNYSEAPGDDSVLGPGIFHSTKHSDSDLSRNLDRPLTPQPNLNSTLNSPLNSSGFYESNRDIIPLRNPLGIISDPPYGSGILDRHSSPFMVSSVQTGTSRSFSGRTEPSPFNPSLISTPTPPDVASFMQSASIPSQPLIPEPSPYPSNHSFTSQASSSYQSRESYFSLFFNSSILGRVLKFLI